jgi:hypothetical protein
MNIQTILQSKPNNPHFLTRYYNFIVSCQLKTNNIGTEIHHICPKAADLFPEYSNIKIHTWNSVKLTYREHLIAHWILSKAYKGSQIYAFVGMCNQVSKRGNIKLKSSRAYELARKQTSEMLSIQNKGYAVYKDIHGNSIRCKTDDSRVISGELISSSAGRKYKERDQLSRNRTSEALTGKKYGPRSIQERIARRTNKIQSVLYFDPYNMIFIEADPILVPVNFIKVFTSGRQVWNSFGDYRRVSSEIPIPPPGWSFINPKIIFKIINLITNEYQECTGDLLPGKYHNLALCKTGKILLYCNTSKKKIYIDRDTINTYGIPVNCTH